MKIRTITGTIALAVAAVIAVTGCVKDSTDSFDTGKKYSRVTTLLLLGNNSLSGYIRTNSATLAANPLPPKSDSRVVLVYEHLVLESPKLLRYYSDWRGTPQADTLMVLDPETISADHEKIAMILDYVKENFESDHYGMLVSSHGTGWLPENYYAHHSNPGTIFMSIGSDTSTGYADGAEISLPDFADCIHYKQDYIILDACLMGGVEVAYQLRDKTDRLVFSATEILARGYCYDALVKDFLGGKDYDADAFCQSFYDMTLKQSGTDKSCTISSVLTANLENLAGVCTILFEKYRPQISKLKYNEVQGFFTNSKTWFYDLVDIMVKAGITDTEKSALESAIGKCVTYCAHTDNFLGKFDINTYCGFSMYLPGAGNDYLNGYYSSLDWNKATGLVKQ